jgi:lipoprotein NlpD
MKEGSMVIVEKIVRRAGVSILIATLAACAANRPAPVSDARPSPAPGAGTSTAASTLVAVKPADGERVHVIQKGETLISIALQNGLDYRELAAWNNIENPNVIKLGESLRLTAPGTPVIVAGTAPQPKPGEPVATPLILTPMPMAATPSANTEKFKTEPKATKVPYSDAAYAGLTAEAVTIAPSVPNGPAMGSTSSAAVVPVSPVSAPVTTAGNDDVDWAWPIQPPPKGKVIANFTDANKGIDISGAKNSPVLASAAGKVVYSGAGLRGYGRLVIIKHNNTWLSAYAHNEKILVAESQSVKKGEKIAEMGNSDADQVKLHFEIRKQGKPVDPAKLLPN